MIGLHVITVKNTNHTLIEADLSKDGKPSTPNPAGDLCANTSMEDRILEPECDVTVDQNNDTASDPAKPIGIIGVVAQKLGLIGRSTILTPSTKCVEPLHPSQVLQRDNEHYGHTGTCNIIQIEPTVYLVDTSHDDSYQVTIDPEGTNKCQCAKADCRHQHLAKQHILEKISA